MNASVAAARRNRASVRRTVKRTPSEHCNTDSPEKEPKPDEASPAVPERWYSQSRWQRIYQDTRVQFFVAALITTNFISNVIEKQINPAGEHPLMLSIFIQLELIFTVAFTIELIVNMYANWFWPFWTQAWNVFDFTVVLTSLLIIAELPLPPWFGLGKAIRAFRIFRLFKRLKSLNRILSMLLNAVPGMLHAFAILMILTSVYALLAVELFRETGCKDGILSGRGNCIGDEYFGTFGKASYTLFQMMTGESWSEAIARPLMWSEDTNFFLTGCFFVSYQIFAAFVLVNVVVAVLLDNMVDSHTEEDVAELLDAEEEQSQTIADEVTQSIMQRLDNFEEQLVDLSDGLQTNNKQQEQLILQLDKFTKGMSEIESVDL